MAGLKLVNIYKNYYSGDNIINAVKNLNLDIKNGELISILGPSGCGKSSTMRMIAGLEDITSGDIYIDGKRVNELGPSDRNIALAFESYALYQHLTVRDNIGFCLKIRNLSKEIINQRILDIAELIGIENFLNSRPAGLSGGQQQLVSLARALVRQPSITLLDEPISHLDTKSRINMTLKIRNIHSTTNLTMIYVTHNQEEALSIADRIAVMNQGELLQIGTRSEIMDSPRNLFVANFVGEPAMNFLNCSFKSNGIAKVLITTADGSHSFDIEGEKAKNILSQETNELIVGIRPNNFFENKRHDAFDSIVGEVVLNEFLGESNSLKFAIGKNNMTAVLRKSPDHKSGDNIELFYNKDKLYFFNPENRLLIT